MLRRTTVTSKVVRFRPSHIFAPEIAVSSAQFSPIHTSAIAQKSATEVVKENLDKLNKKIGKVAAEGIEKTQEASNRAGDVASDMAQKAEGTLGKTQQKTKEKGAELNEKAQSTMGKVQDKAEDVGKKAESMHKSASKSAARNIEDAQDYVDEKTK